MQGYNLRELASICYFAIYDDFRWYLRRGGENKKTILEVLNIWFKLINPITPHLSEELNLLIGNDNLVSASEWPKVNEEKISLKANSGEDLVRTAIDGMRNVLKLAKLEKAEQYTLFIAQNWLYELFNIVSNEIKVTRNLGEIMRKVLEQEQMKMKGKEISKIVQGLVKDVSRLPSLVTSQEEELKVMEEAKEFLEKEFNCSIKIINGDDSDNPKAKAAMPGKVGILVK